MKPLEPPPTGIYIFFILFGLSILALILLAEAIIMFRTFKQDMSVRAICVSGTRRHPVLGLADNRKYHLFLSRASAAEVDPLLPLAHDAAR